MFMILAGTAKRGTVTERSGKSVPGKQLVKAYRASMGKRLPGGSFRDGESARTALPCVTRAIRRGRTRRRPSACARIHTGTSMRPDKTIESESSKASECVRSQAHQPELSEFMTVQPRADSVT